MSLSWRLRRAERLQSAVFATVYRENADDVVLWPKHGLPIQPGPGEDEVILGQVVMTDFARAQVLDRLLVYERRIENSLYRTMAQLRRERETRVAAAGPEEVSRSDVSPVAGREPTAPAELASFGANVVSEAAANVVAPEGGAGSGCDARIVSRLRGGVSSSGCVGRAPAPRVTPVATETSLATPTVSPSATLEGVSRSDVSHAAGQEPVAEAELGSCGAEAVPEAVARGEEGGCGCDAR
ncbi:MAG: hypothetical protein RBU21_21020, partial [FCB group bacterium]|nr:hypothetical protein [FCB group bacterium]